MKVICCVPARLNSKRLPRKLMLEINGKPILQHTIERVAKANKLSEIWVCTTKNKEDDEIADFIKPEGKSRFYDIHLMRGDEKDIISRLVGVANYTNADIIVNVDAEQPLMDPWVIDRSVEFIERGFHFFGQLGIPLGSRCYAMSKDFLKFVWSKNKNTAIEDNWWKLFENAMLKEFPQFCIDTQRDFDYTKEIMEKEL